MERLLSHAGLLYLPPFRLSPQALSERRTSSPKGSQRGLLSAETLKYIIPFPQAHLNPASSKQFGISAFNCKFSPHSISEHMHPLPLTGQKPPSCVSSLVLQCSCMLRKNIFAIQACHVAVCFNTMILPSRQIYLSFKFKLPTKVTKPCISLALFPC